MLKHINEEALEKIIQDGNNMWKKGKISNDLKSIKIIATPKPNKDVNNPNNYRPIALLPTLIKILNSAVLFKLKKIIVG